MKAIRLLLSIILLMLFFSSCNKCNNENPTAQVVNNGTASVNAEITAADGDIITITDLEKGLISSKKSYTPGSTVIDCTIEGNQISQTVDMVECTSYDITITSENKLVIFSAK